MAVFYGQQESHFRSPEELVDVLRRGVPEAFDPVGVFGDLRGIDIEVEAPVFLDAFTAKRKWRTTVTLVREVAVPEEYSRWLVLPGELAAPRGTVTELEGEPLPMIGRTNIQPGSGIPGPRRVVVRDVFDVIWISTAYGAVAPGTVTWHSLEGVDYAKRSLGLDWPDRAPTEQRYRRRFRVPMATIPTVTRTGGCPHWSVDNVTTEGYDLVHYGSPDHQGYAEPSLVFEANP